MSTIILVLLTSLLVSSQGKVAYRTNYEDLGDDYAMNEEKPNIENDVDSVREEENFVNSFSISNEKRKEKDERTSIRRIPDKFIRLLEDVKSSSEAKRILSQHFVWEDEEDAVEKREAVTASTSIPCQIPRASNVTTLKATNPATLLDYSNELHCEPVPVRVKLTSTDGHYYPTYTTLHRCMGSCGSLEPDLKQCEVVQEQEIKYSLMKLSYEGTFGMVEIKVKNHTDCDCDCIVKESHCDPEKMEYKPGTCACECKTSLTCPDNKKLNQQCLCECKLPPIQCPRGRQWSKNTCRCEPSN